MKSSQLIVLGVALASAVGAGLLAKSMLVAPAPLPIAAAPGDAAPAPPPIAIEQVLVVAQPVGMGESLPPEALRWQAWPRDVIDPQYIVQSQDPTAIEEVAGAAVRVPLAVGEPLRKNRLVGFGKNYMSAVLPEGMRAMAVRISVESTGGGFVLPNDYVDLLGVRKEEDADGADPLISTKVILENVRVLAIDQYFRQGPDGPQAQPGQTATLELTPEEVSKVTIAQQYYDQLTLVLRSVKDVAIRDTTAEAIETIDESPVRIITSGSL